MTDAEDGPGRLPDSAFDPFFDRVYPDLIKRGLGRCGTCTMPKTPQPKS
nr:hypothetical protein [Actinoplanes polyasparticus]